MYIRPIERNWSSASVGVYGRNLDHSNQRVKKKKKSMLTGWKPGSLVSLLYMMIGWAIIETAMYLIDNIWRGVWRLGDMCIVICKLQYDVGHFLDFNYHKRIIYLVCCKSHFFCFEPSEFLLRNICNIANTKNKSLCFPTFGKVKALVLNTS